MGPCPARRARRAPPVCLAALALTLAAGLAGRVPVSTQARAGPPPNLSPLWQKAVETYRANRHWYPERAVITSEVLDGHHSAEVVYRYETEWPDLWVVKDAVIRGSGGFLFIKRHFKVTTIFSQYVRWARDLAPGGPSPR